MPVAEKYRVVKGFRWMGAAYERGDSISRAAFLADSRVGESRLGSMQRTGFIMLDPATRPLDKMTKADLVDYGREVGATVDPNMVKKDLITAIQGVL
jgi:hypothetical protein